MKQNSRIKSLQELIFIVQLQDIAENAEKEIKSFNKKQIKYAVPAFAILGLGSLISLFTLNPIFFWCGLSCFGGISVFRMVREDIDFCKYLSHQKKAICLSPNLPVKVQTMPQKDDKKIKLKNEDDFYSDIYREDLAEIPKEGEKTKDNLNTIKYLLSKDETQERIVYELEVYSYAYKLPPIYISPKEWDLLFDIMYEELTKLPIKSDFYSIMNYLLQYVLSSALIHNLDHLSVINFINEIKCLVAFKIPEKELIDITRKITESLSSTSKKLIYFNPKDKR